MWNLFVFFPSEDLWHCLEQASGKPIAAVMSSWTKQMGFPIIVVDQEQVSSGRCTTKDTQATGSFGMSSQDMVFEAEVTNECVYMYMDIHTQRIL